MKKRAIISGCNGQDGSYLAELLLHKDYEVFGMVRRSSTNTHERIAHLKHEKRFSIIEGDVTDATGIYQLVHSVHPHEIYNLAAQSHVHTSFAQPTSTFMIDAIGPLNFLEAVRQSDWPIRFYQASTSELFGDTQEFPQSEKTVLKPCSPYAIAKLAAHHTVRLYRDAYNIFACAGILFNHESSRRGENFVTRKITKYVAELSRNIQNEATHPKLKLGNLDAKRDWGHAKDYVEAMWMMLQAPEPDDYVVATGSTHTVRDFVELAFKYTGISDWSKYVVQDPEFFRPHDVNLLLGDPTKIKQRLGWIPRTTFAQLVQSMVDADMMQQKVD